MLKRYWLPESGEISPAESEFRALALAADRGISAPSPIWIDRVGLFPERAIVISYVEGAVLLDPTDPNDWASQLADALIEIHRIQPASTDRDLFPVLAHTDGHQSEAETLAALRRHPLGMELWATREEILASLKPEAPVYVHHDFWPGNTLWTEQKLAAVIDWEGGAIADPALDVAYCALDMQLLGLNEAAERFRRGLPGKLRPIPRESGLLGVVRPLSSHARYRNLGAGMAGDGGRDQR